jgi:hypothetical protein
MKQALIGAVIILMVGGVGFWVLHHEWTKDRGQQVGFALGKSQGGQVDLHVIVSRDMTLVEGPALAPSGAIMWLDWVKDHFDLRDDAGQPVPMLRAGTSTLINEREAFNPEFYVTAKLRAGTAYTLDYIPHVGQPKRNRHTFTAPAEGQAFQRIYFKTVHPE